MGELTKLPNVGKELESQLQKAGIENFSQLENLGSREVWLRIKAFDTSACYNRLCALEGAIRGVRWHLLDDETKKSLKDFYNNHKK